METLCYLQGEFIPLKNARIGVFDRGFLYGDGLFETMPVYEGKIFRGKEHLLRLREGARILGINLDYQDSYLEEVIKETVKINNLVRGFIRLTLSRGSGQRGLSIENCREPLLLAVPFFSIPYSRENYNLGFGAVIVKGTRRNSFSPLSSLKTINYLDNILSRMETDKRKADEGILLNTRGELACGTVSNLFIYRGGVLATPSPECGILKGISRGIVLELARGKGIEVEERPLFPDELFEAKEAFLTNSLMEIMPLTYLEKKPVGSGNPGPLTQELKRDFERIIGFSP